MQETATVTIRAEIEIVEAHLNLNENKCIIKGLIFPLGKASGSQPSGTYTEFPMDDDVRIAINAVLLRHMQVGLDLEQPNKEHTEYERV